MKWVISSWILLIACTVRGQARTDSLLAALTNAIEKAPAHDAEKLKTIQRLQTQLHTDTTHDPETLFRLYKDLYDEYRIFHYDSAYSYAEKMQDIALRTGRRQLITEARLNLCFILLSSGLFRETYDSLRITAIKEEPDSLKAVYYTLMGRYYYDLANYDYDGAYHSQLYDIKGNGYMDSALAFYPPSSFEYIYYSGLRDFKSNRTDQAAVFFEKLLNSHRLTDHQLALTTSTLSGIYQQKGQTGKAIDLMIQAALADIRSSTKETFAIFNLADLLYKNGDVRHASLFIESAIANAEFYGARQRKVQVSSILSLIEGEKINAVESERRLLIRYSVVVTLLLLVLVALIVIIRRQVRQLKKAQQMITEAHEVQRQINEKLEEANKIKEEYIGYFFSLDSEFFVKLERLKRTLDQKIAERKWEDVRFIVGNIQLKKEKEELLKSFDTVFLRIFPDFVDKFNSLFKDDDRIHLKENELLNIDLRIFALIRMGITDNDKIAQILGYSVNTIYTYKTRIKNRSIVPNDEFEARIKSI
ncbi:MAG: tetratricopeptide repeat protein [Chitinophagaceae bacterium]|nr:tetratricopeptide repeat protein [Chitinophagaceae bacterium]